MDTISQDMEKKLGVKVNAFLAQTTRGFSGNVASIKVDIAGTATCRQWKQWE
ncbi:hypothetical protein ACNKHV_25850 [Shigella flexneri]